MSETPERPDEEFLQSGEPLWPSPPEPERKTPLTLIIGIALLSVVVGVVLAKTLGSGTDESVSAGATPTEEAACIDADLAASYTDEAATALSDGSAAIAVYDVDGAVGYLRDAADAMRQSLLYVHNVPEVTAYITTAADEYDAAADDLEAMRLQSSIDHLRSARRAMEASTAFVDGGGATAC